MSAERYELNKQLAQMLKGGVIMDVTTPEQARIAEEAGACAVMALERIPADIRAAGGVSRMSDPKMIKDILEASREKTVIYVGLSTLEYLKKGGRINTTTALAANLLNIKPVMKFGTGKLDVFQKCRGMKKSRKAMIDAMHRELETTFKKEYDAGKVYLMAASSSTAVITADWISQIRESFPGMDVMCDDLSLGLSCHIGPDGLGIGCSCMPL